jgi:hypothetical protein
MADQYTVPAVVIRVIDGSTLELELDLGWRIRLGVTATLIGIHVPPVETDEGLAAKRTLMSLLHAAGGCTDGTGAEVMFSCYVLDAKGSHGQVSVTTPQGAVYSLGDELLAGDLAVPSS